MLGVKVWIEKWVLYNKSQAQANANKKINL
jgi:hypothetical protein